MDGTAWIRTYALAATLVLVSVGGHVAGGGTLPYLPALGVVVAVCAIVGRLGARRDWRPSGLVLLLSVAQLGFHLTFVGASPRAMSSGGAMQGMAGMSGMPGMAVTGSLSSGAQEMSLQATGIMITGHLAAALLSALLLVHADRAFCRLVTLAHRAGELRTALGGLRVVAPAPAIPPRIKTEYQPYRFRSAERRHQMRRRGPPLLHSI